MRIREISLRPYRNFERLELELGLRGALIVGGNGRGKSNILESISYLSLGKSVRGARDQEAVPRAGAHFDIRGVWEQGGRQRLARVYYSRQEGKRAFLDDAPLARVSELVSQFRTVHFSPQDTSLVLLFAAQRRRLLDILLSQACIGYLHDLQRYSHVLTQRNRYLRTHGARRVDHAEREAWDSQLAVPGAAIRRARLETLVDLAPVFAGLYEGFCTGRERAGFEYRSQPLPPAPGDLPSVQQLEALLRRELAEDPGREERAGHTLSGPHRDGFGFTLDGESAAVYGSQGQLKGVLLSWKMAESRYLEARSGEQPVLLLDDVFSELDEVRSRQLLRLTEGFEQVIMTAPRTPIDAVGDRFTPIMLS